MKNVVWANECERPRGLPRSPRGHGTAAKGLTYERAFARAVKRAMPGTVHGQWFVYYADGLLGYCQPDIIQITPRTIYVIEVKLTDVERATEQLLDLYFPVLRRAYAREVRGIIATRSVHRCPGLATVTASLREALTLCHERVPVLHWIGSGSL